MSKKFLILALIFVFTVSWSGDLIAGALVKWGGNYAGTAAATYVPGAATGSANPPHICRDINGGAVPPAVSSLCWAARNPVTAGGAWAYAYANIIGGNRVSIAASGTWGPWTFAGKAAEDTTSCSTYVEIIEGPGTIDLVMYSFLTSLNENNYMATVRVSAVAGGDTLFYGGINYRGDESTTNVEGEFNAAGIIYGAGNAEINHVFPGIDLAGHDPNEVEITVSADANRLTGLPSSTVYGLIVLVLLLLVSGFYLYRRRRVSMAI